MRKPVLLIAAASVALVSCGWSDSRLNPGNWFGNSREVVVQGDAAPTNPLIPAPKATAKREEPDRHILIESVTEMRIERTTSGAIIYASGVGVMQGVYDAQLRLVGDTLTPEDGVLELQFMVLYPNEQRPVGSERTRTVTAARSLTTQELQPIKTIRVTGAQNSRESRRR